MAVVNRTFSILCLRLGIKEIFIPLYLLVRAVVTWTFVDRQEKCLELITFELVSFLTRHSWLLTITIQYEYFVI